MTDTSIPPAVPPVREDRTRPYRPSNGTEGEFFMARFCDRCRHDQGFRDGYDDSCLIATATLIYDVADDAYPKEWIEDADEPWPYTNPRCTAFESIDAEPKAHIADRRQMELFA